MQPDFQCSSKKLKNILLFFSATVLGLYFALQSAGIKHKTSAASPAANVELNTGILSEIENGCSFF
jgi:hypothetical protein